MLLVLSFFSTRSPVQLVNVTLESCFSLFLFKSRASVKVNLFVA